MNISPSGITFTNNPLVPLLTKLIDGVPLVTRCLAFIYLVTLLPTLLPLSWLNDRLLDTTALCVQGVREADDDLLLQFYRFIIAPFLHTDFVSGAISIFALIQLGQRIELQKGSVALVQIFGTVLLLTQTMHLLTISYALTSPSLVQTARSCSINLEARQASESLRLPIWGAHPATLVGESEYTWKSLLSYSIPIQVCSINPYAIIFTLLVYECHKLTRDTRRFIFLIPFSLPIHAVPLAFLLMFQFWFGIQLHVFFGVLIGYLFCYLPFLVAPVWLLRQGELSIARQYDSFMSVERAGKMQPFRHFIPEEDDERTHRSSTSPPVSTNNSINSAPHPNRAAFPVFRNPRAQATGSGGRRPPASAASSSSSASSSASSSDAEDISAGGGISRSSSGGVSTLSPRGAAAAHFSASALSSSATNETDRSAILAANVARILEPASVYPTTNTSTMPQ